MNALDLLALAIPMVLVPLVIGSFLATRDQADDGDRGSRLLRHFAGSAGEHDF